MEFNPGFRLSRLDIVVLIAAVAAAVFLFQPLPLAAMIILFVVGHFFLFCNVLRMSRVPELIWSGAFVLLSVGTLKFAVPPWWVTLAISLSLTFVLTFFETRKPSYHGAFWRNLNPGLPKWFAASTPPT